MRKIATVIGSVALALVEALSPNEKVTPPANYPMPGLLGTYVVSAVVNDTDQTDGMGAVTDSWGFEWYYSERPDLHDGQKVTVVYNANGTPDDLSDDFLVDIFGACPEDSPCHED